MPNAEHVEIVKQGAKVIAAFQENKPIVRFDLSDANLGWFS